MKLLLATALLAARASVRAEMWTGNDLLAAITSPDTIQNVMALGYVAGVHDTGLGATHCPPSTVTLGQVRDMARVLLIERPVIRERSADAILTVMLRATWPCRPTRPGVTL